MSETTNTKLTPGQTLWFVPAPAWYGGPRDVVVSRVGHKWADIADERRLRLNVATMIADGRGFTSPGRFYRNRAAWVAEQQLEKHWESLLRWFRGNYRRPPNVSLEQMRKAAEALGIEPD